LVEGKALLHGRLLDRTGRQPLAGELRVEIGRQRLPNRPPQREGFALAFGIKAINLGMPRAKLLTF
jgi:hypothetical protein